MVWGHSVCRQTRLVALSLIGPSPPLPHHSHTTPMTLSNPSTFIHNPIATSKPHNNQNQHVGTEETSNQKQARLRSAKIAVGGSVRFAAIMNSSAASMQRMQRQVNKKACQWIQRFRQAIHCSATNSDPAPKNWAPQHQTQKSWTYQSTTTYPKPSLAAACQTLDQARKRSKGYRNMIL